MRAYIKVIDVGTDVIRIPAPAMAWRPTELHCKRDGDKNDEPSLTLLLEHPDIPYKIFGQFSLRTLRECMEELGYTIFEP